jgi:hypothetical protein
LKVANDANDEANILRSYGYLLFVTGDPENGRAKYRLALDIFQKYPTSNNYTIESYHFITEGGWSNAENLIHQCGYARAHADQAELHLKALAPGPTTDQFKAQLNQIRQRLDANCKPS